MTPNDFCYWLQGFLEISNVDTLDAKQLDVIRKHLALVFKNVTSGIATPQSMQEIMSGVKLC